MSRRRKPSSAPWRPGLPPCGVLTFSFSGRGLRVDYFSINPVTAGSATDISAFVTRDVGPRAPVIGEDHGAAGALRLGDPVSASQARAVGSRGGNWANPSPFRGFIKSFFRCVTFFFKL